MTLRPPIDAHGDTDSEAGYLLDAPHPGAPLLIAFGSADWTALPPFDFVGRLRKLRTYARQPLNILHVRDTANFWYQHGVRGLGDDVRQVTKSLAQIIADLNPPFVATLGQSMGGYGAILFGALLGVDRVLAFGPLSYLRSDWARRDGDLRWLKMMETLDRFPPVERHDDLLALVQNVARPPAIRLIYGRRTPDGEAANLDVLHAERLAGAPSIQAIGIDDAPHAVVKWLIDAGCIDRTLSEWLLPTMPEAASTEGDPPACDAPALPLPPTRSFDAGWRGWIAENLLLGVTSDVLLETLTSNGFPVGPSQQEIDRAARSPYLRPSAALVQRSAKREWLLEVKRRLAESASFGSAAVPRHHRLSRHAFVDHFYSANRPVVITGMMEDWPAMDWTLDGLARRFATRSVQVQTGRESNPDYEMEAPAHRSIMSFPAFIAAVTARASHNDVYMTAGNAAYNQQTVPELWDELRPIPEYLQPSADGRDGLPWIGPAGTVTPAHHDLTNNMMAQISGRKRIWLVDSSAVASMDNQRHVYSPIDLENVDHARFPAMRNVPVLQVDLAPGELLFVPIGWWHQVRALEPSITITYTNFLFPNDFFEAYPR